MTTTGLEVFDTTLHETNHWLKLMMGELKFQATETTSHIIPPLLSGAVLVLGVVLRGTYCGRWHPAATPGQR